MTGVDDHGDLDRLVRIWRAMYGDRACEEARKRLADGDGPQASWPVFVRALCRG